MTSVDEERRLGEMVVKAAGAGLTPQDAVTFAVAFAGRAPAGGDVENPWASLEVRANQLVEKSGETLSFERAAWQAVMEDPELARLAAGAASVPHRPSGAWDRIEKAADRIVEKSDGTPMSRSQAIAQALKDDPSLYAAYMEEQSA